MLGSTTFFEVPATLSEFWKTPDGSIGEPLGRRCPMQNPYTNRPSDVKTRKLQLRRFPSRAHPVQPVDGPDPCGDVSRQTVNGHLETKNRFTVISIYF